MLVTRPSLAMGRSGKHVKEWWYACTGHPLERGVVLVSYPNLSCHNDGPFNEETVVVIVEALCA